MTDFGPTLTAARKRSPAKASTRTRDAETSRLKILVAAEKLFAERGYLGVTLDDIARRSGTKRSLMLYHFKSKFGLWKMASERAAQAFNQELADNLRQAESVVPRRPANVAAWLDAYVEHPNYPRMLVAEGSTGSPRLEWLIQHSLTSEVSHTLLPRERLTQALVRDVVMAIILAMTTLGPLMEFSMAKLSGEQSVGLHPMSRERRNELIDILVRIIETFEHDGRVQP